MSFQSIDFLELFLANWTSGVYVLSCLLSQAIDQLPYTHVSQAVTNYRTFTLWRRPNWMKLVCLDQEEVQNAQIRMGGGGFGPKPYKPYNLQSL